MTQQRNISCSYDANSQVLTPMNAHNSNITGLVSVALIETQQTEIGGITGTLSYGGGVRAFLTFDDTGRHVISYSLTVNDYATQQSVENIIGSM